MAVNPWPNSNTVLSRRPSGLTFRDVQCLPFPLKLGGAVGVPHLSIIRPLTLTNWTDQWLRAKRTADSTSTERVHRTDHLTFSCSPTVTYPMFGHGEKKKLFFMDDHYSWITKTESTLTNQGICYCSNLWHHVPCSSVSDMTQYMLYTALCLLSDCFYTDLRFFFLSVSKACFSKTAVCWQINRRKWHYLSKNIAKLCHIGL